MAKSSTKKATTAARPVDLVDSKKRWEKETLAPVLSKNPESKKDFSTISGIPIDRIYTPLDTPDFDYEKKLGYPGVYPFTRGVHPTMYRGKIWTMRQFAGFGTAEESNRRYKYLLTHGETGLSDVRLPDTLWL